MDTDERMSLPDPGWDPVTRGYWFAAGEGRLVAPQCTMCGVHRWPPSWACYSCQSRAWRWDELPGTGTVFSYTWADHRPDDVELYDIAVIEVDGTQGEPVRIMTRVVDVTKASLRCDLAVEVVFAPIDDEVAVPFFRPRAGT